MDAEKMQCLTNALEYIENNLSGEITQQQCAMAACCSVSGLQKTFKSIFRIGVSDYITRRRLTKAAELLQKGEHSALEIAMICGYGSAEAFTRAFTRVWGVTPTVYKKEWSFSNLFPRLDIPQKIMYNGGIVMKSKFDISELYNYLKEKSGTYVLVFDTAHLMEINHNYGSAAGDKVILECLQRIDAHCTGDMVVFRIGGDEFAMVTGLSEKAEVEALAQKIMAHNGEPVVHEGAEIPVKLRSGAVLLESKSPKYHELFAKLVSAAANEPGILNFSE